MKIIKIIYEAPLYLVRETIIKPLTEPIFYLFDIKKPKGKIWNKLFPENTNKLEVNEKERSLGDKLR